MDTLQEYVCMYVCVCVCVCVNVCIIKKYCINYIYANTSPINCHKMQTIPLSFFYIIITMIVWVWVYFPAVIVPFPLKAVAGVIQHVIEI